MIHLATAHSISLCRYTYFEKQCLRRTGRENFDLIMCNCGNFKRVSNLGNLKAVELNNCTLFKKNDYNGFAAATSATNKGAVPLQAWSGPEGSRKLRFPDFMTTTQDGGKISSLTHRPSLPPGNAPGTHFCYRLSCDQSQRRHLRSNQRPSDL